MKTIVAQLSVLLDNREIRQNLPLLFKFVALLAGVILVFTIGFKAIMLYEGRDYTWVTGFYWTLTVMSTLGFGDITFLSDLGRAFSVLVLLTGIVMLLIVLPFAFIRFFYAPWLEAQIKSRVPRELDEDTDNHVIICADNVVSSGLIDYLVSAEIEYVLLEPDPQKATHLFQDGIHVMVGDIDLRRTYELARASQARMVVANLDDVVNTNITLTVRSAAPEVKIAAIAEDEDAIDVLELSGVDHVLPIKRWLGEQLANRANSDELGLHPIGEYESLRIAELPVLGTPLVGKTVRETRLRQDTGVSIIGIWVRGKFESAAPDMKITSSCVPVVMGTEEQLAQLDDLFEEPEDDTVHPVLVIGGGKVGEAALRALEQKEIPANLLEKNPARGVHLESLCYETVVGDASAYHLLKAAGIEDAPTVLLTTNDDAMNIYLSSYCRQLNPDVRIVSRLASERNLDAIHRAGADFVLSYATLAVNAIASVLHGRSLTVLGEGVDLFPFQVTPTLNMVSLAESGIGARTGMSVVAIRHGAETITRFTPSFRFEPGMELLLIGSTSQFEELHHLYP